MPRKNKLYFVRNFSSIVVIRCIIFLINVKKIFCVLTNSYLLIWEYFQAEKPEIDRNAYSKTIFYISIFRTICSESIQQSVFKSNSILLNHQ